MQLAARTARRPARAFTLVEVLATMALMAIVLPVVTEGMGLCLNTGLIARRQSQASSLAQGKLAELLAAKQLQDTNLQGDFGADWPEYRWQATVSNYEATVRQISVTVRWTHRQRERSLTLTSLAYQGGGGS